LKIIGVVVLFVAHDIDETAPATPDADHFIAFPHRAESDRANCWVQPWDVAAAGEDSNDAFFDVDVSHVARLAFEWSSKQKIILRIEQLRKRKKGESKFWAARIKIIV